MKLISGVNSQLLRLPIYVRWHNLMGLLITEINHTAIKIMFQLINKSKQYNECSIFKSIEVFGLLKC